MSDVTQLLNHMDAGDSSAAEKLLPLVYQELRRLAAAKLSREGNPGQTLQPTVLVHEAYIRLVDRHQQQKWKGKPHFFGAAAEAMRRILVDNARKKSSEKHGGQVLKFELDESDGHVGPERHQLLDVHEALAEFEQQWPARAELVKLRYFAGMTIPEASKILKISTATAERHWRSSKAWLHAKLSEKD